MPEKDLRLFVSETYATNCHDVPGVNCESCAVITFDIDMFNRLFIAARVFQCFNFVDEENMIAKILHSMTL